MIALWFMLRIAIVHDTPLDLDFHYNVDVGHVWSIFKCFVVAWMVFDLSSIPFELFICLQVIPSRFANYIVLEFWTCIFSSMIIDVMFIVYCCQCVGTGYSMTKCKFKSILHPQKTPISMMSTNLVYMGFGQWVLGIK
jgi:hypothetical protein